MPTTQHSAAAASHNQNDHLAAHEQSKLAQERSREAHEHTEQLVKTAAEKK